MSMSNQTVAALSHYAEVWANATPEERAQAIRDVSAKAFRQLDERDQGIVERRTAWIDKMRREPGVGDWVDFADGVSRRISYVWEFEDGWKAQTSDGGSFYLGGGSNGAYVSFSGSLYSTVPTHTFDLTFERRPGRVWFFHHDSHTAGGGVDTMIDFKVWECSLPAPR